jgi:hypothetical protein
MNAYLHIKFVSGLGDTYTTIMSALECSIELENLGYNPHLILNTDRNQYLPPHIKLDCLFDFGGFKNEIIYNPILDNNGFPIIDGISLVKLNQNQSSYLIYVDEYHKILDNYQSYIFGHLEISRNDRRPTCNIDIINHDIKKQAYEFIGHIDDLISLHYRTRDGLGNSEEELMDKLKSFEHFIDVNQNNKVLICSNGKLIKNYLKKNNIVTFNFTYDNIELYPCYDIYNKSLYSDEVFIKHSQEIMTEMVLMKYSKKILSISPFLSNFVTYGILNNIHNLNYNEIFV